MLEQDRKMVRGLVTATTIGAFAGMALVGWLMFFDVSSIGTMVRSGTPSPIFGMLVIGGWLLKGGLLGFILGLAGSNIRKKATARGQAPVSVRATYA